jgi:hypothetical protein
MFVAVERLLIKLRQPASRAAELIALGHRVRAELVSVADDEERALAKELRARKLDVAAELAAASACGSCASGYPQPMGCHAGGACCSGVTAHIFDDDELAALVLAGTRPRDLTPPPRADEHAGCAFRAADGCTLAVAHRPARCVHYTCNALRRELHARGRLGATELSLAALDRAMQRFAVIHRARTDRDMLASIAEAVAETSSSRRAGEAGAIPAGRAVCADRPS